MLSGFGEIRLFTQKLEASALLQNLLLAPVMTGWTLQTTVEAARKVRTWKNCKKVVVKTTPGDEESVLTLSLDVDWQSLQIDAGELAENVNVTLPITKEIKVPTTAPFEISDPAILAASDVRASLLAKVGALTSGHLLSTATAPTGRQFQIAAGKLTFPAALAGAAIAYSNPTTYTSVPSIGKAPSPILLKEYSFIGHGCGDEFPNGLLIHIPLISQTGKGSINTDDETPVLEIPFDCLVAPGERAAVHKYNLPTAV